MSARFGRLDEEPETQNKQNSRASEAKTRGPLAGLVPPGVIQHSCKLSRFDMQIHAYVATGLHRRSRRFPRSFNWLFIAGRVAQVVCIHWLGIEMGGTGYVLCYT